MGTGLALAACLALVQDGSAQTANRQPGAADSKPTCRMEALRSHSCTRQSTGCDWIDE